MARLKFLKKINWYKLGQYNDCILMKYLQFASQKNPLCKEEVRYSYRFKTFLNFGDVEYLDWAEIPITQRYLENKFKKNKKFFLDYVRLCIQQAKECVKVSDKLKKIKNFSNYNNEKLCKLFEDYIVSILKVMPFVNTLRSFENFLIAKMYDILIANQIEEKQIQKYLLILGEPGKEILSFQEKRELLELAKEIQEPPFLLKKNKARIKKLKYNDFPQEIQRKIKLHQKKYSWMGIIFMRGKPYSVEKFLSNLKNLLTKNCPKELQRLIKNRQEREKKIKQIIKKLSLSKNDLFVVEILRKLAFLRAYRIDMINISNYNALNFLTFLAKKLSLGYEDLLYLAPREIKESLINKKSFRQRINIRKKGWGIILYKNRLELIVGKEFNLIKEKIFEKDYSKIKLARGLSAFPGKVIGKAFISLSSKDLGKITSKDILIAPETTVDFEIAMAKVKAIVTDTGGILSHAAIVSREFKKPCIVGTDFGTRIFKTGDLIEVDANKGVVRILKRLK